MSIVPWNAPDDRFNGPTGSPSQLAVLAHLAAQTSCIRLATEGSARMLERQGMEQARSAFRGEVRLRPCRIPALCRQSRSARPKSRAACTPTRKGLAETGPQWSEPMPAVRASLSFGALAIRSAVR